MYKGYCVSEQEVVASGCQPSSTFLPSEEVWLCSILKFHSLLYAQLLLPLKAFECHSCSLPHQQETGGSIWAFGEGGASQEWIVDFTEREE